MAEIPYPSLAQLLREGEIIPFFGAGASSYLPADAPPDKPRPPVGAKLAEALAEHCKFPLDNPDSPARTDLIRVASFAEEVQPGRRGMRLFLRDQFAGAGFLPNPLHQLFANLAKAAPLLVMTTNYDDLMEQALRANGVPFHLIISAADRARHRGGFLHARVEPQGEISLQPVAPEEVGSRMPEAIKPLDDRVRVSETIVLKIHGSVTSNSVTQDTFVISERDYLGMLSNVNRFIPPILKTVIESRAFLFLGYSLRDWNLRLLLDNLRRRTGADAGASAFGAGALDNELNSYVVSRRIEPDEIRIWEKRGINPSKVEFDAFVPALRTELGI